MGALVDSSVLPLVVTTFQKHRNCKHCKHFKKTVNLDHVMGRWYKSKMSAQVCTQAILDCCAAADLVRLRCIAVYIESCVCTMVCTRTQISRGTQVRSTTSTIVPLVAQYWFQVVVDRLAAAQLQTAAVVVLVRTAVPGYSCSTAVCTAVVLLYYGYGGNRKQVGGAVPGTSTRVRCTSTLSSGGEHVIS